MNCRSAGQHQQTYFHFKCPLGYSSCRYLVINSGGHRRQHQGTISCWDITVRANVVDWLIERIQKDAQSVSSEAPSHWNNPAGHNRCRDWTCNLKLTQERLCPLSRDDTALLSVTHHSSHHCAPLTFVSVWTRCKALLWHRSPPPFPSLSRFR